MLKKLSFALLLLVCLAGCKSKTALNYNQDFVKKETALGPDIESTDTKVSGYIVSEQWDSIAIAGERMEKLVDAVVKEIKDKPAPDVKEGQNFKDAGIRYFEYMKSMYTLYKAYGQESTPEGRAAQLERLREFIGNKKLEINHIQEAQKKFADANGFRIEKKE